MNNEDAFAGLYGIVKKLRGEGGCPWDRKQSPHTLRGDLIEETYECIEAIDEADPPHIMEELGDLFLLVTMISYMHEQEGSFSVSDVLHAVSEKLIRRHPHVFGELKAENEQGNISSEKVLENWAKIKVEQEGRKPKESALDEVSRALPPLDRAWKLQKKAAKLGFDWKDIGGVLEKLAEELDEVEAEISQLGKGGERKNDGKEKLEEELGDLLFSVVNLCRFLGVEPSLALQRTNVKFVSRFGYVEEKMKERGEPMNAAKLGLMDDLWNEAKKAIRAGR